MLSRFCSLSLSFVLFFFTQVTAQMPIFDIDSTAYFQAVQSVQVSQNNGNLLPLQHLEQAKVALFSTVSCPALLESLQKYTDIQVVNSKNIQQADFNTLIVFLPEKSPEILVLPAILAQANIKKILILPKGENTTKKYDAVLKMEKNTPITQSIAAQMIFGGITADHKPFRLGYAPPAAVGINKNQLRDSIRAIVKYGIEQGAYPGAQVLVAKNGKIIYHETFGSPTYDNKRPISTDDIYDMASVTKVSAALPALMKLTSEGKFHLDEPMKELWPDFKHTNKADLTWRSVLAHNARLQPWIAYWKNTLRKKPKRNGWRYKCRTFKPKKSRRYPVYVTDNLWLHRKYRKKIFKAIKETPLNKEPGYKYSGLAFYLFPTIVENITGDEFEHYLKSNFYEPLGANTLTFNPLRLYPKSRIIPTELDTFFRMKQLHGTVHDEGAAMMGGVNGNAGLFGTANDMAKLWQMYMNMGSYGGQQFIKKEVLKDFSTCQYCDEGNYRGLGFDKPQLEYIPGKVAYAKDASPATFGHSGYTGTLVWVDPENEIMLLFLSNRVYKTRKNRKLYKLDLRPRIHNAIYSARVK